MQALLGAGIGNGWFGAVLVSPCLMVRFFSSMGRGAFLGPGWGKSCSCSPMVLLLQAKWTWGPDGQGAVLLVNCDRDSPGVGGTDSGQADIRTLAGGL